MDNLIRPENRSLFWYALALALLWYFLRWLELRFLILSHGFEVYAASSAVLFTSLGLWLADKLSRPTLVTAQQHIPLIKTAPNSVASALATPLSKRELQVLELMARGMSNNEIADALFISTHTIKTHGTRIFEKLEVKRRIQAVEKARRLQLIA